MHQKNKPGAPSSIFLGIECGGSHTEILAADSAGKKIFQATAGPANLRLLSDPQLAAHFAAIHRLHKKLPRLSAIAIGMPGARSEEDRHRIRRAAAKTWPKIPCYATNDLETALNATENSDKTFAARVLMVSGTGSCCFGQNKRGKTSKIGGWGHFLGDKGSGYEIGLRALKAVVYYFDRDGKWPSLGQKMLNALALTHPDQLINWTLNAPKNEVAALAREVFAAWARKDKIAADILESAASRLARDAVDCARKISSKKARVQFLLSGSILCKQPAFAALLRKKILQQWPKAVVVPLERESVWGAVQLAKNHFATTGQKPVPTVSTAAIKAVLSPEEVAFSQSPTEERNPLSLKLDKLPLAQAITLMLREDAKIPAAIQKESGKIEEAIEFIVAAFQNGGRLFYTGAGTSGRLGVLDASECPPTFRTSPEMVQGIIAGGQSAIWKAVEGAEDDPIAGAESMRFQNVSKKDVVVGITASGRTPFVWGSLREAKKRGAKTVLLCFNPHLQLMTGERPDLIIAPNVGPEILTGSTRLKAGTATKLILNILTTLAMVRIGKVKSNLMIDLNPSNVKLRERAVRIVQELTCASAEKARIALEMSGWVVKSAYQMLN
ncbi:MAG: N-acetylmuramic acid 6-phosphate etherase [Verrucomicrobiota bacterium]